LLLFPLLCASALWAQGHVRLQPQFGVGKISSVAFSRDGRLVLTAGSGGKVRLWDVATGYQVRAFEGDQEFFLPVAIAPDGRSLVTVESDHALVQWEISSGKKIRSFVGHTDRVSSLAFSPDGRWILSGSLDSTARLWDAKSGRQKRILRHSTPPQDLAVRFAAFSDDGRYVATGNEDGTACLWSRALGKQIRCLRVGEMGVNAVAFSPDGQFIVTGSDSKVQLWQVSTGRAVRQFKGQQGGGRSVAFSPDGRLVASGGSDNTAKVWEAATGRLVASMVGHEWWVDAVAFSPDGRTLLTGSEDESARLWDVTNGKLVHRFFGHTGSVSAAAYSADGRLLLTSSADGKGRIWDTTTGQQTVTMNAPCVFGLPSVLSADGRLVLLGGGQEGSWDATLWDATTGKQLRALHGHSSSITSVALSADGRLALTGSNDKTARVWDVATGRQLHMLENDRRNSEGWVNAVAFSPDGRWAATGSGDNLVRLWDVATGALRDKMEGHTNSVVSVAFSADGQRLLSGSMDHTARLWEVATGNQIRAFEGHGNGVRSAIFSRDGRQVLTASDDGTARLWDAATGRQVRSLNGHASGVQSAVFSPDERMVLTAGDDSTAKLWDAGSGKELVTLIGFENSWAVTDSEGRFDSNELDGGLPLVWVLESEPTRPLPLEIFMRDYYTPRLLSRVLNGEPLPPIRSIAEIKNRVQPDVSIGTVTAAQTQLGRGDVVVHAASHTNEKGQASGLQDLRLFRNGQLVGYREGALNDGDVTFSDIQLPTSTKSVTFTAYAFNSERIKSATAQKDYQYAPGPAAKPRAWLVQIGVNHYQASDCELHGSANDAEQLGQILSQRLKARGLDVRPTLLVSTDQVNDATKQKIHDAFAAIATAATPDDVFFLSFSGHGYSNQQGQFYILAADVQGTCDSASSVESNDFKPGPMGSRGLGQLAYDKRMRILAASQPNQPARESDALHQGLLSYALTEEGLIEGRADWQPKDGEILVGEWLNYAANAVPKILQSGAIETGRGLVPVGKPEHEVPSIQTPAVFDFSKQDTFVLQ
jgi:WD40 repeat protein